MNQDKKHNSKNKPLVSVIIPCYNGEKFIAEAIESVLSQTYKNWELLIINDGSTDNSKNIIENYITSNKKIKLFDSEYNNGVAKTKNTGIANAKGRYISFLDQDDIWLKLKLELQLKCFELGSSDIGVVCTGMLFTDVKLNPINIFRGFNDKNQKKLIKNLYLKPVNSSSIMMLSEKCISQVGSFEEKLIGWDDYELLMRAATKFRIKYVKKPLVVKRMHKFNLQKTAAVCNETENVFNYILSLHPSLKKYSNIRDSNKLYSKAIKLLEEGDKKLALSYFKKSIKKNPINITVLLVYILTIFIGKYSLKIKKTISSLRITKFMYLKKAKKIGKYN